MKKLRVHKVVKFIFFYYHMNIENEVPGEKV